MASDAFKVPVMFAVVGTGVLLLMSGLKGASIADIITGRADKKFDPKGGSGETIGDVPNYGDTKSGSSLHVTTEDKDKINENALKGVGSFDGVPVARWIIPYLQYARKNGWKGTVQSGYRTYAKQYDIYYVQKIRPAAKPGTSNHEGSEFPRGAVDVTEWAQLNEILKRKPGGSKLKWAGMVDKVHFSYPHNGSY